MKTGNKRFEIHPWQIIESEFKAEKNEVSESVFTLSNEFMGTRGLFEEDFDGPTLQGCYLGGIYLKMEIPYAWKRPGFPTFANSLINTTNWLGINITVAGEQFNMASSKFKDYQRILDMETGVLSRSLVFVSNNGCETQLKWERFLSHDDLHCGVIRLQVRALNHNSEVKIELLLDGRKENRDFGTQRIHTSQIASQAGSEAVYLLKRVDSSGHYFIHSMVVNTNGIEKLNENYNSEDKYVSYSFEFKAQQDKEYSIDKLISVWTSREAGYPWGIIPKEDAAYTIDSKKENEIIEFLNNQSSTHIKKLKSSCYESLKHEHIEKFSKLWEKFDIEIEGDQAAQQGIRYSMFQLLSTYNGNDSTLNIGPKGHSGENYNGRTFWDSDSYDLPFYLFANPTAAKSLIEYRHNGLDAARERAKELCYKGAIYPMTTFDGTEDCEVWEYALTEIHINTTIAYAIYLYEKIIHDLDYVLTKGLEVVLEIARFFTSRAKYIPARDGYAINFVCGPDEWRSFVNNNWYTNYMAKWLLEYAAELVQKAKDQSAESFEKLTNRINFDDLELVEFAQVADKIILNRDDNLGIYLQDEETLNLDPLSREELVPGVDLPIDRLWSDEKKFKCSLMKQPDVLLAMFLQQHRFDVENISNNYRFYEQRCVHGSSLSPGVHSILASRIGRYNQAYEYYLWAARLDLDDLNFNVHEGLHISSMAGSLLNVICGFGGMIFSGDKLEFNPTLPQSWKSLSFKLSCIGTTFKVSIDQQGVNFVKLSGNDLSCKVYGQDIVITEQVTSVPLSEDYINRPELKAAILDLDGVIVDTAKCHYKAWKILADKEAIYFDEGINEHLKGISRMDSLEIILQRSNKEYTQNEKDAMAKDKNDIYVKMLEELTPDCILPGIADLLKELKDNDVKTAICSASENTNKILEKLNLRETFDVVVIGNDVTKAKPHPEGVNIAIERLGVKPQESVLVEDAFAGIEAGIAAGTKTMGIGDKLMLHNADYVLCSTEYLCLKKLQMLF